MPEWRASCGFDGTYPEAAMSAWQCTCASQQHVAVCMCECHGGIRVPIDWKPGQVEHILALLREAKRGPV